MQKTVSGYAEANAYIKELEKQEKQLRKQGKEDEADKLEDELEELNDMMETIDIQIDLFLNGDWVGPDGAFSDMLKTPTQADLREFFFSMLLHPQFKTKIDDIEFVANKIYDVFPKYRKGKRSGGSKAKGKGCMSILVAGFAIGSGLIVWIC
jgi:hypothetical protein